MSTAIRNATDVTIHCDVTIGQCSKLLVLIKLILSSFCIIKLQSRTGTTIIDAAVLISLSNCQQNITFFIQGIQHAIKAPVNLHIKNT